MAKAEITTIFDQPKTRLVNGSDADPDDFPFGVRR
jgi:hypothetical protein